jgi:hypothetical protein
MGRLVLHAGRGKTGTSSIQRWLAEEATRLRAEHGVHVLTIRPTGDPDRPEVIAAARSSSKSFIGHAPLSTTGATALFAQLDERLQRHSIAVVSSEAFGTWFYNPRSEVLPELEKLALEHDVRVAYYVRPQHTALEAGWRQWGFRQKVRPSEFIKNRLKSFHYCATFDMVCSRAPNVAFIVRPFRPDLLHAGDAVTDFAANFLGLVDVSGGQTHTWDNRGWPLELVNILRYAPDGLLWTSPHDNAKLAGLRKFGVTDWPLDESTKARSSRLILQAFCHAEYEAGNQRLINHLGWSTDHFVPPVELEGLAGATDLAELDSLWEPDASESERALLFHALSALVDRHMLSVLS